MTRKRPSSTAADAQFNEYPEPYLHHSEDNLIPFMENASLPPHYLRYSEENLIPSMENAPLPPPWNMNDRQAASPPRFNDAFQHDLEQSMPLSRSPTPVDEHDLSGYYDMPSDEKCEYDTKHFGPAPRGRMARRHKMKQRIVLTHGNLVADIDVPTKLVLPRRGEPEMMQAR